MKRIITAAIAIALAALPVSADNCGEKGYLATFDIDPKNAAAFEAAVNALAAKVMEVESGVLLYAPFKDETNPARYYMFERYETNAAREAHAKDPAVVALFGPLMGTLAGQPVITPVAGLCAE